MDDLVLGVDVGGTRVRVALVDQSGQILARVARPTRGKGNAKAFLDILSKAIQEVMAGSSGVRGIALACAGIIDTGRGVVTTSPNIPALQDFPLRQWAEERFRVPTCLLNDASAAALGEHLFGAGKGADHLVYLTLSTGIGGGIILDSRLYLGAQGAAGEIGHMVIEAEGPRCACGNQGCLEALASGTAIAREARERLKAGEGSSLSSQNKERLTARMVHQAARQGDPLAREVIARAGQYLGIGLANIVNIFNPQKIVLGGGVARLGGLLLEPAEREMKARACPLPARGVEVVLSPLGDRAGLLGVAAWFWQQ